MDFLKEVLSEETYNALTDELKDKEVKLADLSKGEYVRKEKYDTDLKNLNTHFDTFKTETSEKLTTYEAQKDQFENEKKGLLNQLSGYKTKETLASHKVSNDYADFVKFQVEQRVNDDTDFETALKGYLEENPQYMEQGSKVSTSPGSKGNPSVKTGKEKVNDAIRQGFK